MSEELCPLCGKEYWSTECPHDFQEMQEKIATLQRKLDIAVEALNFIAYPPNEWDDPSDRAMNTLEEIEKVKDE